MRSAIKPRPARIGTPPRHPLGHPARQADHPALLPASSPTRIPALPTLAPAMLLPALTPSLRARPAAFPLAEILTPDLSTAMQQEARHSALYYLARNGVHHGLRALRVGVGDTVLMPAYHHGVEVEAVRSTGAKVVFYRVDKNWRIDLDDVAKKAPGARVLYLTYFAGFPQPTAEARALARQHGLLFVEDCALSLFSKDIDGTPVGSRADLSVFCLYKTLPVPHGGIALCTAPLPAGTPPPLLSTLHHLASLMRAHHELHQGPHPIWEAARALSRHSVDRVAQVEKTGTQHMDPAQLDLGASSLLQRLLPRFDGELIAIRRRRNYQLLFEAFRDEKSPLGPLSLLDLPAGTCPLFFPIVVRGKRLAMTELHALGIEAIDFWGIGDAEAGADRFPEVAWLRRHVLEVPIHQDLDDEAVARVARAVKYVVRHA